MADPIDRARAFVLIDCSSSTSRDQRADLGAFRATRVAIVESIDPESKRATLREGYFEPRNFHEAIGKPLNEVLSQQLERRFGVMLISDLAHSLGGYVATVIDPCSPCKNDWDAGNASTRMVDGADPRGLTGLLPQIAVMKDVPGGQVCACIPIGPTLTTTADGSKIPAGYVVGKPAPASSSGGTQDASAQSSALNTAALSTFFYVDPTVTGQGSDGTPSSKLGARTDALFGDVVNALYGPLLFDKTDSSALAEGSTISGATEYQGKIKWNSTKKVWVPTFWASSGGGGGGVGFYGDGSDGALVVGHNDSLTPVCGGVVVDTFSGPMYGYTPTAQWFHACGRPLWCTDLTIDANTVMYTGNYAIYVSGTLTLNGEITCGGDGMGYNNVSVFAPTNGHSISQFGAPPGQSNGPGLQGSVSAAPPFDEGGGGAGIGDPSKISGAGGAAGGHAGGAGIGAGFLPRQMAGAPFAGSATGSGGAARAFPLGYENGSPNAVTADRAFSGGCSGGSGAGDASSRGGDGGAGGGVLALFAKQIVGSGKITCSGGRGLPPLFGPNAGGGGGGNGGVLLVFSKSVVAGAIPGITVTNVPGSGGAGVGSGSAGTPGGGGGYTRLTDTS